MVSLFVKSKDMQGLLANWTSFFKTPVCKMTRLWSVVIPEMAPEAVTVPAMTQHGDRSTTQVALHFCEVGRIPVHDPTHAEKASKPLISAGGFTTITPARSTALIRSGIALSGEKPRLVLAIWAAIFGGSDVRGSSTGIAWSHDLIISAISNINCAVRWARALSLALTATC